MEHAPVFTPAFALLIDPSAAHSLIERVSSLKLPRRICRPLDRRREQIINPDLARFDAEVEAANDEDIAEVEEVAVAAESADIE